MSLKPNYIQALLFYITDGEISIPGYTFSRNDRNGRSGGGGTLAFERWHPLQNTD
jgi:hypothetical protein